MEINNTNQFRIGNITSSEIVAITGLGERLMNESELAARPAKGKGSKTVIIEDVTLFDKKGMTYIEECNMERLLMRSLTNETNARPTSWGNMCERRVFEILPTDYRLCSQDTIVHPAIDSWSGSPDCEKFDEGKTCPDIKCPMTLKSFCQLVDPFYEGFTGLDCMNAIRNGWISKTTGKERSKHDKGEQYYWQIVSNAILLGAKYGELIIYVPYLKELSEIRDASTDFNNDQNKASWTALASDNELPYLIEGGYYKNITIIRFEIPQKDKDFLTQRVIEASKLLIERKEVQTNERPPK